MQAREAPLELDRNLNKTMVVATTRGKGQPGFFCDVCNRTYKDSVGYLDHLNSRGREYPLPCSATALRNRSRAPW